MTIREWLAGQGIVGETVLDSSVEWLLEELRQAPGVPPAIDCVWGDWELVEEGVFGPCLPDSSQPGGGRRVRIDRYMRDVLIEAANGGASCSGTNEELREFSEPCVYVPPVLDPDPGETQWVDDWRDLPTEPSEGDKNLTPTNELCAMEAQWHDEGSGAGLDHGRHIHVGTRVPRVVKGVHLFWVRMLMFHWNGVDASLKSLTDTRFSGVPISKILRPDDGRIGLPITEHIQVHMIPVLVDTRASVTDGRKNLTLRMHVHRPDRVIHLITGNIQVTIANGEGRPIKHESSGIIATGWMTEKVFDPLSDNKVDADGTNREINTFGYQVNKMHGALHLFEDDGVSNYLLRGSGPRYPLLMKAMHNPNLHSHPPDYGSVLPLRLDKAVLPPGDTPFSSSSTTFTLDPPEGMKMGDRIVTRVSDTKRPQDFFPNFEIADPDGHTATLIVVGLGGARS